MRHFTCLALLIPVALACGNNDDDSKNGDGDGDSVGSGGSGAGASSGSGASGFGASSGTGATSAGGGSGAAPSGAGGDTTGPMPLDTPLIDRIGVTEITVTAGVQEGVRNWRIWGTSSLNVAPVYTAPASDCGTLVCYTSGPEENSRAHVVKLNEGDQLVETFDVADGFECRGLAVEPTGHFAVLLWDKNDRIYVERFDSSGVATWGSRTELTNADNKPTDFGIGESRLEYGDGKYGAYYHVHSNDGHEGDTLKYVDAASGAESTEWGWGCSHSMSELLRYNEGLNTFLPVCVTDCFPGTSGDFSTNSIGGIYLDHRATKVMDVDAGCNGSVAGELGGAALADDGWKLVFNAHQAPAGLGQDSYTDSKNQDIGFSSVDSSFGASSVVWLTNTPDIEEADSSIARLVAAGEASEQYVVGWSEPSGAYQLALVDGAGTLLSPAEDVSSVAQWGRRDDPFRRAENDDIVWAWFDAPGSTTLRFARLNSGTVCAP